MSALDTFEWFVTTQLKNTSPDLQIVIKKQREYLFSLRSEDERQRSVEDSINRLRDMASAGRK